MFAIPKPPSTDSGALDISPPTSNESTNHPTAHSLPLPSSVLSLNLALSQQPHSKLYAYHAESLGLRALDVVYCR